MATEKKRPTATSGNLSGRRVAITGAARGIGLALAKAFVASGAKVLLVDADAKELKKAVGAFDKNAAIGQLAADISSMAGARKLAAAATKKLGGLDVLVCNAAICRPTNIEQAKSVADWEKILRVNLSGAFYCVKAALPLLKKSKHASVVTVSSTQGLFGQPLSAAYSSSKGGLISLTRSLAVDLAVHGIRVNSVAPGFVDTRMAITESGGHEHEDPVFLRAYVKERRIPLAKPAQPEDIVGPVLFFAGNDSSYVTGQVLAVDGGLSATY